MYVQTVNPCMVRMGTVYFSCFDTSGLHFGLLQMTGC